MLATVAPYRFGGELAVAIRKFKYGGRADLARQLAPLCADQLAKFGEVCDMFVPVPLHWRREFSRGFNQARALLRFALSRADRTRINATSLRRIRPTRSQSGLARRDRADNVRAAFRVRPRRRARIRGARVLLFDDVVTTGATLAAATRALKKAGAASVVGFALARAA